MLLESVVIAFFVIVSMLSYKNIDGILTDDASFKQV